MGEPHRRLKLESVALAGFDREREQAVRGQRSPDSGEQRRKVADIDEHVRGDDEIEGIRPLAHRRRRASPMIDLVIDARSRAFAIMAAERSTPARRSTRSAQRLAHEASAAAEVERRSEAAARRNRAQGVGDEGRGAIAEIFDEMLVEAPGIIVEQARDIGLRQRARRVPSPNERKSRPRALRVGGIGGERLAKGLSRGVEVAEFLPGFAKREPRRRPVSAPARAFARIAPPLRSSRRLPPQPWRKRNAARRRGRPKRADRAPR